MELQNCASLCTCAALDDEEDEEAPAAKGAVAGKAKVQRFDNGFILQDLAMGQPDGKLAKAGNKVRWPSTGCDGSDSRLPFTEMKYIFLECHVSSI